MNAKAATVAHYNAVENHARDIGAARATIEQLRYALHDTIAQLSALSAAISIERVKCVDVMDQAHAVLMATLPGADLDAMSKPERVDTLLGVLRDIGMTRVP